MREQMSTPEMQKRWREKMDFLEELHLPDSLEWADKNIPQARAYIEETHAAATKAMVLGERYDFDIALERYIKAWLRLWQRMAIDHFKSKDIMDVDMRYYRHLPDGYSMTWDSKELGHKFIVFPRRPKKPPKDMKWLTAVDLIKIDGNPIIMTIMKKFGAWIDKSEISRAESTMDRAIEEEKKNPPPV